MDVGEMKVVGGGDKSGGQGNEALGLAVRSLSKAESRQADVAGGVLVESVSDGAAARAGIQPGDVILYVNGEETTRVERLRSLLAKKSKLAALLILRQEQKIFVPVSPE